MILGFFRKYCQKTPRHVNWVSNPVKNVSKVSESIATLGKNCYTAAENYKYLSEGCHFFPVLSNHVPQDISYQDTSYQRILDNLSKHFRPHRHTRGQPFRNTSEEIEMCNKTQSNTSGCFSFLSWIFTVGMYVCIVHRNERILSSADICSVDGSSVQRVKNCMRIDSGCGGRGGGG
jgi:hypothetical protein